MGPSVRCAASSELHPSDGSRNHRPFAPHERAHTPPSPHSPSCPFQHPSYPSTPLITRTRQHSSLQPPAVHRPPFTARCPPPATRRPPPAARRPPPALLSSVELCQLRRVSTQKSNPCTPKHAHMPTASSAQPHPHSAHPLHSVRALLSCGSRIPTAPTHSTLCVPCCKPC